MSMTEEKVTTMILAHLKQSGWQILCFDFPQSGTGRMLHPDDAAAGKNSDSIIPDIVAVKAGVCLFFEDKDRFYKEDYDKCYNLITRNRYTRDISLLLAGYAVDRIYYGIGLPESKHTANAARSAGLVDFVVGVGEDGHIGLLVDNTAGGTGL